MTHQLKCWSEFMRDIITGEKSFEVRKDDRDFSVGDTLILKGWDNKISQYTDNFIEVEVNYILCGGAWGIEEGYVVMGIKVINYNF